MTTAFPDRLKHLRTVRGLSQPQLAEATTISQSARDSCTYLDIEPGSYGAIAEDQSGQSDDLGFTIEQP